MALKVMRPKNSVDFFLSFSSPIFSLEKLALGYENTDDFGKFWMDFSPSKSLGNKDMFNELHAFVSIAKDVF